MLLSGHTGHRLEPMGVVGCALVNSPILHCICNDVCNADVERSTQFDGLHELLENFLRQLLAHYVFVKHVLAENFRDINHCTTHLHAVYLKKISNKLTQAYAFLLLLSIKNRRRGHNIHSAVAVYDVYYRPWFSACQLIFQTFLRDTATFTFCPVLLFFK